MILEHFLKLKNFFKRKKIFLVLGLILQINLINKKKLIILNILFLKLIGEIQKVLWLGREAMIFKEVLVNFQVICKFD